MRRVAIIVCFGIYDLLGRICTFKTGFSSLPPLHPQTVSFTQLFALVCCCSSGEPFSRPSCKATPLRCKVKPAKHRTWNWNCQTTKNKVKRAGLLASELDSGWRGWILRPAPLIIMLGLGDLSEKADEMNQVGGGGGVNCYGQTFHPRRSKNSHDIFIARFSFVYYCLFIYVYVSYDNYKKAFGHPNELNNCWFFSHTVIWLWNLMTLWDVTQAKTIWLIRFFNSFEKKVLWLLLKIWYFLAKNDSE